MRVYYLLNLRALLLPLPPMKQRACARAGRRAEPHRAYPSRQTSLYCHKLCCIGLGPTKRPPGQPSQRASSCFPGQVAARRPNQRLAHQCAST